MLLNLDPTDQGFAYRAEGKSHLGSFTSRGAILLPEGRPAIIQVAALDVSGTSASGTLRSDPGGFTGRLDVAGGGLDGSLLFSPVGSLLFSPVGSVQRIEAHLTARDARFAGPPPIAIRRGKLDGVILLNPGATSIEAKLTASGLSRGPLSLARVTAEASLRGGSGRIRADIAGTRGRDFVFRTVADIAPDRVRLSGEGTVDRRPIQLSEAAEFTKVGDAWRLAPTALTFAGGSATVSGLFGPSATEVNAKMERMPLTVLDIAWPELGLGGIASGTFSYRAPRDGVAPTGDVNLRIRGLTRSGLVLSSRPVDVGVVAKLDGRSAAMRAVAVSDGRTIGRAQARLSPIGTSGDIGERLANAPLFAQLRYNGPADTLWRLTGLELLDFSGPVAIGADARGTLEDPQIQGSLRTERARLESAVTGTVIENIQATGRFGGSRLVVDRFTGTTKEDGRVSGRAAFDLSATRGIGMDVTEVNRPADEPLPSEPERPWRLDMNVRADNRLTVTGLGINSEWSANLDLGGTVTQPSITGRAELIRGSYDFAGRRFDLERGTIRFQGETPINPVLDIVAEGGLQGLNATIRVTGRGQKPEIAFTSTPALPQDELLSRLLFGTSITNLSAPEALQLAAAVASLNESGGGLDPINAVRAATGLDRLRILPADISTGQGTSIAAGKYIGRRVYVEVITDGRGYSATQVEYQITRWLSLLSSISTIGRESINVRVSKDY